MLRDLKNIDKINNENKGNDDSSNKTEITNQVSKSVLHNIVKQNNTIEDDEEMPF